VRTRPTTPLAASARGIAAGLAGTYALDLAQKAANKLRGEETGSEWESWDEAPVPAKIGKRIIEGVFQREVSTDKIELVNNAVHWSYGALWGMLYGLVQGSVRAKPLRLGLVFGAGVWGFSYVALPVAKLYKPIRAYPPKSLALDLSYHLAYGAAAGATYEALDRAVTR
jgi:hypothetical protein